MNYQLRISHRAKHARIRIKPNRQVEVVLPFGVPKYEADKLIKEQHVWLSRTLANMPERKFTDDLPKHIDLKAINQCVSVTYVREQTKPIHWDKKLRQLSILESANIADLLQVWLKRYAKSYLRDMLDKVAQEMDVSYTSLSVRLQKTRWGSCSQRKSISLNAKLLLLPQALVHYVLVHELAHVKHMNHSAKFWQYVARFEPDYRELRKAIRSEAMLLPTWLLL
jgi:predicted metal-dependent hydrolase